MGCEKRCEKPCEKSCEKRLSSSGRKGSPRRPPINACYFGFAANLARSGLVLILCSRISTSIYFWPFSDAAVL
jgi:hypothetical protein